MNDDALPDLRLCDLPGARVVYIPLPGNPLACNPSIAADGADLCAIVRTVNYTLSDEGVLNSLPGGRQLTSNWMVRFDNVLNVTDAQQIDDAEFRGAETHPGGFEDCRLFRWRDAWWMSATVVVTFSPTTTKMALCRLDGARVAVRALIDSPRQAPVEKNWMPFVAGRRLGWIYRIDPMEVMRHRDDEAPDFEPLGAAGPLEGWNGSSQCIPYRGRWLCVVHRRRRRADAVCYEHRFVELSRRFRLRRMSEPFMLERPVVEFCAGLCIIGRDVILSYGVLDREAKLMRLERAEVERLLREGPIPRGLVWLRRYFASSAGSGTRQ